MSIALMAQAWQMALPMTEKMILLCLSDFANDAGICWPSVDTIAAKCSCSDRTVQKAIKSLKAMRLVSTEDAPGRPHLFKINLRNYVAPEGSSPPKITAKTPKNIRPRGERRSPEPSMNHQEPSLDASHPRDARPAGTPGESKPTKAKPVVPEWMPAKPWNGYLEMRKRMGKAPTDRAIELMIAKLDRWRADGHDPGAILDTATEHNWTGLYEPKEPRNAKRNDGSPNDWRGSARSHEPDRRDGFTRSLDETIAGGRAGCAPVG